MAKKYKIIQVHLANGDADTALSAMLRDGEWEFVCCVPIRDEILVYTFCRELSALRGKAASNSAKCAQQEPGIRSTNSCPMDPDNLVQAYYNGAPLVTITGAPLLIPDGEKIIRKLNSTTVIGASGNAYSLWTGELKKSRPTHKM